jgi:hypothetical protein
VGSEFHPDPASKQASKLNDAEFKKYGQVKIATSFADLVIWIIMSKSLCLRKRSSKGISKGVFSLM